MLLTETSPGLCHEPALEFTASRNPQLHFIFENSVFVGKRALAKLQGHKLPESH